MKPKPAERAALIGATIIAIAIACVTVAPLVWLIAAVFKTEGDLFHYPFFSPNPTLQNFHDLFTRMDFWRQAINSIFVSSTIVVLQLVFSSMAGYALAKFEFRGRKMLTGLILLTIMIPWQVTLAPLYELAYRLHLIDSYAGIILPGAVSVLGIFLFRQAMQQVPNELIFAARIDGCNEGRIYAEIVMPTVRPMIGAFCLMSFMSAWNNFLWPQIVLHNTAHYTLPVGLTQLVGLYGQSYGMMMAGTLLSILPVAILFLTLQKEFVAGLTSGAVKG